MADNEVKQEEAIRPLFYSVFHFKVDFSEVKYLTKEPPKKPENPNENEGGKKDTDAIDDIPCQEVSGFGSEIQTEDLSEGGQNLYAYKLPKPVKYKNLVIKKALPRDTSAFVKWAEDALKLFKFNFRDVTVSLLGEDHKPVKSWSYVDAYPIKYSLGDLNATTNQLVIETLELAYKYSYEIEPNAGKD